MPQCTVRVCLIESENLRTRKGSIPPPTHWKVSDELIHPGALDALPGGTRALGLEGTYWEAGLVSAPGRIFYIQREAKLGPSLVPRPLLSGDGVSDTVSSPGTASSHCLPAPPVPPLPDIACATWFTCHKCPHSPLFSGLSMGHQSGR